MLNAILSSPISESENQKYIFFYYLSVLIVLVRVAKFDICAPYMSCGARTAVFLQNP